MAFNSSPSCDSAGRSAWAWIFQRPPPASSPLVNSIVRRGRRVLREVVVVEVLPRLFDHEDDDD
jgi:hypothetical protein